MLESERDLSDQCLKALYEVSICFKLMKWEKLYFSNSTKAIDISNININERLIFSNQLEEWNNIFKHMKGEL